jgi:hypothetical protein
VNFISELKAAIRSPFLIFDCVARSFVELFILINDPIARIPVFLKICDVLLVKLPKL